MSDELERRLRDSLRAYADLVDAPETTASRRRAAAPAAGRAAVAGRDPGRGRRAAVVTGSLWSSPRRRRHDRPSAAGSAVSGTDAPGRAPESDSGAAEPPEPVGTTQPLAAGFACAGGRRRTRSSCTRTAGCSASTSAASGSPPTRRWWRPPATRRAGWGNPYQPGTLTLLTADEAVFARRRGPRGPAAGRRNGPPGALRLTTGSRPAPSRIAAVDVVGERGERGRRHRPLRAAAGPPPGADDPPADGRRSAGTCRCCPARSARRTPGRAPPSGRRSRARTRRSRAAGTAPPPRVRQPASRSGIVGSHQVLDPVDVERLELRPGERPARAGVAQR